MYILIKCFFLLSWRVFCLFQQRTRKGKTPGSWAQEKVLPRAGGTQAVKPGLGIGCWDLVNDSGWYLITMAISMVFNHDGWMDGGGTADSCHPAFPRTALYRRAHQSLLWSDHGELVESPEQMFCQYTPALFVLEREGSWNRSLA